MKSTATMPRFARRATAVLAGVTAAGLALTGCAAGSESDGDTVTIVVQQQANWDSMMSVLVPAFEEANPGIKIELSTIDNETRQSTNSQIIAGNNPPDVALVSGNAPVYYEAVANGELLDLTDVWENAELYTRYGTETQTALQYDGTPYLVGIAGIYFNLVFYNADIFDEVGIDVPDNHRVASDAEFFAMSEALRDAGYDPLAVGGAVPFQWGWQVAGLLQSYSTAAEIENYMTSYNPDVEITADYTDDAFVNTIERLQTWADAGVYQDGYLGQDYDAAQALFFQGRAGMLLSGNFTAGAVDTNGTGFEYGWFLAPAGDPERPAQIMTYLGEAMAIPAGAAHPEEAKKFLEFWISDAMQADAVANSGFALPSVNTLNVDDLPGVPEVVREMVADANEFGAPIGWTAATPGSFSQQPVGTEVASMLAGQLTAEQIAENQQQRLLEIRSE